MEFDPISLATAGDPALLQLLASHSKVLEVQRDLNETGLCFVRGGRTRHISVGVPSEPLAGLVELMDNNPLVCADRFSVPDAASTLALIALGPLCEAGLLLAPPVFISNLDASEGLLSSFLQTLGWPNGLTVAKEAGEFDHVCMATCMAEIETPANLSDLDGLYAERFERSFFVRLASDSDWSPLFVRDQNYAAYRLRITVGDAVSLLTIQVIADQNGKCGAAQVVHAMNVMAGFEETLGLE